jgi:tetratricopeptide (TPR) repeat protein
MSTANSPLTPVPQRRLQSRWLLGTLGLAALLMAAGYLIFRPAPAIDPPRIDLTGVDPAVQQAIRKANEQVRKQPRSAESWGQLGMILHNHIFADQALVCYAQAERFDAEDVRWPYFQALIVMSYDPPAALAKMTRAAALPHGNADRVRLRMAELYLQLGQWDDAKKGLEAVLQESPRHPRASLGLARVHCQNGELDLGRDRLQAALGHPLTRLSALRLSAEIHQRQGDAKRAQRELAQAVALPDEPEWPDDLLADVEGHAVGEAARIKQASRLLDRRSLIQAARAFQDIVRDYPKSEKGWLLHGYSLLNLGWLPQAEESFETALSLNAGSAQALLNLGIIKMLQKDHRAAGDLFRQAIGQKPDSLQAHLKLGECMKTLGERPAAIAAFRDALRCQPLSAVAHAELGALLLRDNQPQAALVHLQQAVDLNPNDAASEKLLDEARKRGIESKKS